ncbi:dienelactone hydrolase family protein [Mucilaginibacter sp. Bleaf8]|uniref:dienelactone hydrolase family protein n=1 Tax=Mucilaginibacter sp. Bleaf8 TaxID=2834430 RepID=UPI001BD0F471|nr:dienelactone hydrolase family protein [Mucilaginibacter sp. Bleaf8]MBS7565892.1 dienelactone hydrolase family protein [Mucilaginibacter sp. Bleaf8]
MKKLILFVCLVVSCMVAFGQNKMACCHKTVAAKPSATQKFAMLASNPNFRMAHPNPVKVHFQSSTGKVINYKTDDGLTANAYELKAKTKTNKYLLVIHEWYGLNDFIKREAEKLYNDLGNVTVIALDLYDGKVADNRQDAGKYMQAVKEARAQSIIKGALAYAGPQARIATLGWCFGGGWSLQTAIMAGKQNVACVMYYGMPEQNVDRLKALNADVLGNFANKDQFINTKVVAQFKENMEKAGKKLYLHQYDADHGFANPSNPIYNSEATKDAYAHTLSYLKERLK